MPSAPTAVLLGQSCFAISPIFSGGIFSLPPWAEHFAALSISNFGMKCIAAQSDYNNRKLVTAWNSLVKVENQEINTTVTLGQVMDFLTDDSRALVRDLRDKEVVMPSEKDVIGLLSSGESSGEMPNIMDAADAVKSLVAPDEAQEQAEKREKVKLGEVIDFLAGTPYIQDQRDLSYSFSATVGQIMDTIGREKMEKYVKDETSKANQIKAYENTKENISDYWVSIASFAVVFSLLSVIFLEFVDKDKR